MCTNIIFLSKSEVYPSLMYKSLRDAVSSLSPLFLNGAPSSPQSALAVSGLDHPFYFLVLLILVLKSTHGRR